MDAIHSEVRCAHCRDVIGVYEPMVVLVDGVRVRTSRAAERGAHGPGAKRYHEACFARAAAERQHTDEIP
jgi:hypothetical protein